MKYMVISAPCINFIHSKYIIFKYLGWWICTKIYVCVCVMP